MLEGIESKAERMVVGLTAGSSGGGIQAAILVLGGHGVSLNWKLLAHDALEYTPQVREQISRCAEASGGDAELLCRLNVLTGELFARAAHHIAERAGTTLSAVDLIGVEGQKVQHLPDPVTISGVTVRSSLQLGESAVIAERTGVTTVGDFTGRDLAAGGLGSPISPYVDYLLFRRRARGRLVFSIGGTASLTAIPASAAADEVLSSDTGPGTLLIDGLVNRMTGGRETFDHDGRYARRGRVIPELLQRLMAMPFMQRALPKSCGRRDFGRGLVERILSEHRQASREDLLATATRFTADSIGAACRGHVMSRRVYEEGIVSGGGTRNTLLMSQLWDALPELPLTVSDEYGIPAIAKKAMAVAILANETIEGVPNNLPAATGAAHPVVLGHIVPGSAGR